MLAIHTKHMLIWHVFFCFLGGKHGDPADVASNPAKPRHTLDKFIIPLLKKRVI